MAAENCLWGAPRIHGELLKLGIAISERTISRYLRGRPPRRSQAWRTFFANHFGDRTFISPVMFADASGDDIVVDAYDGPQAQTRFVLRKALAHGLKVVIVINKIDRENAEPAKMYDKVLELLMELNATEEQFDAPVVYGSGRDGRSEERRVGK